MGVFVFNLQFLFMALEFAVRAIASKLAKRMHKKEGWRGEVLSLRRANKQ